MQRPPQLRPLRWLLSHQVTGINFVANYENGEQEVFGKSESWWLRALKVDLVSLVLPGFILWCFLLSACSRSCPTTWSRYRRDGSRTPRYKPAPDTLKLLWDFSTLNPLIRIKSGKNPEHFDICQWKNSMTFQTYWKSKSGFIFSVVVTGTLWGAGWSFQTVTVRRNMFNCCCGGQKALWTNLEKFLMVLSQLWHGSGLIKRVLREGGIR